MVSHPIDSLQAFDSHPLHQAARLGDIAAMDRLLAQGADINERADLSKEWLWQQSTPLMVAACSTEGATVETVRWLVERGADLNAKCSAGKTAAWYAVGNWRWQNNWNNSTIAWYAVGNNNWSNATVEQVERLRYLLDAGLDPKEPSLLSNACQSGNPNLVRLLLDRGAIAVSATEGRDYPGSDDVPLFHAAMSGDDECLQLILEAGGDVNLYYYPGRVMLRFAAEVGNAKFVRLVLETAIELGQLDSARPSPLVEAASAKVCSDVLQTLLDDLQEADDPQPYVDVAEILLEYGAEINTYRGSYGASIHRAISNQADRVLDWLLQHGVNPEANYGQGSTALHKAACLPGNVSSEEQIATRAAAIHHLRNAGLDVNVRDREGNTPLQAAIEATATFRIIHHLLNAGLDVNARDQEGNTPLHLAIYCDDDPTPVPHLLAVYTLLQQGADPNAYNICGKTPLMMAVSGAHLDCVRILLEAGADPQQRYAPNATAANAETFQALCRMTIPGTTAIDHALAIYDYWLDRSATEDVNSDIVAASAECLRLLQQSAKP